MSTTLTLSTILLSLDSFISLAFIFFFKIDFAIFGLLHFGRNFRISLSVSTYIPQTLDEMIWIIRIYRSIWEHYIFTILNHKYLPPLDLFYFSQYFFSFLRWSLLCCPGWGAVVQSRLTATSVTQVQAIVMTQLPK